MTRKRALCVGINDYPGTGSDLSGCVNDVRDWAATAAYRGFAVTTLTDAAATKANVVAAIEEHVRTAAPGDHVLIQFSGHGTFVPDTDGDEADGVDEALCPHDIGTTGVVVTDDELYALFCKADPRVKLVFVSDSCHSGSVARAYSPTGREPKGRIRFLPPAGLVPAVRARPGGRAKAEAKRPSALLLSGCQDWQYSYDAEFGGKPNGAFTRAMLDAFGNLPAKGSYQQWINRAKRLLTEWKYPQDPQIVGTFDQRFWQRL